MPAPAGFWKFKVLSDPTGISENELAFNVFPNPSAGVFNISAKLNIDATIRVVDALGRTIEARNVSTDRIAVDLSAQRAGIYTLIVEWEGRRKPIRLQKF
jgi:hypothetical protein